MRNVTNLELEQVSGGILSPNDVANFTSKADLFFAFAYVYGTGRQYFTKATYSLGLGLNALRTGKIDDAKQHLQTSLDYFIQTFDGLIASQKK